MWRTTLGLGKRLEINTGGGRNTPAHCIPALVHKEGDEADIEKRL